jgi:hypothetical protein
MTGLAFRATRGPGAYLSSRAASSTADRIARAARAADAGFASEAAIVTAASSVGAAHPATAGCALTATRLTAHLVCGTASPRGAPLPSGTAPTRALAFGWATGAVDAAMALGAALGRTGTVAGAAGIAHAVLVGGAAGSSARLRCITAPPAQAHGIGRTARPMAPVFRPAALATQADLARLAANTPAFANNRHTALRSADLVRAAAVAVTFTFGWAAPILGADASLPAAGAATLVLRRATHIVNAAGIVSAADRAAD